jgi:hypothetical protein
VRRDIDVPEFSTYVAPGTSAVALCSSSPAAALITRSPGATRSGLRRPSPVGPLEEKYETPVRCGSHDVEPTVTARSALPGR